jgi:hypothetical protein
MNVRDILAASLVGSLLIPSASVAQTLPERGALRQSIERESCLRAPVQPRRLGPPHPRDKAGPRDIPLHSGRSLAPAWARDGVRCSAALLVRAEL